ncbi:MAG TPA: rRNA maturation RNase YbeY [Bacteroidia bacterium]|nr:rRNA maturation RNase YbeY [Bacteroidia bacterium]
MHKINFFSENIPFTLTNKTLIRSWLLKCAKSEKQTISELNYIFCSDNYLKKINKQFLNHNYFTDIITFPTSPAGEKNISGDIFISIDRVRENAKTYGVRINKELNRVMVHGLLHLCGYKDKTSAEENKMREKENFYLEKR